MSKYTVSKNGKKYTYEYDRDKYQNNSSQYNKDYYAENKEELHKKSRGKRLDERLKRLGVLIEPGSEKDKKDGKGKKA